MPARAIDPTWGHVCLAATYVALSAGSHRLLLREIRLSLSSFAMMAVMVFAEVLSASAALLLLLIRRRGRHLAPPTLAFGSGGVCPDVLLLCSLRGRFGDPAMQASATPIPARISPPSWSSPSVPCAFSSRASVSLHTPRQGCLLFRSLLFLVSSTFSHPPSPIHTDPGETGC